MNLKINSILKLVVVVCLVFLLVYLLVFQHSISSVKLVQDKRKSIETTFDEDSGPDCKPNVGQLCPGGFPCPQTGKCPGCKEVLTKVCGDEKNKGLNQCLKCIGKNQEVLKISNCSGEEVNTWCDKNPSNKLIFNCLNQNQKISILNSGKLKSEDTDYVNKMPTCDEIGSIQENNDDKFYAYKEDETVKFLNKNVYNNEALVKNACRVNPYCNINIEKNLWKNCDNGNQDVVLDCILGNCTGGTPSYTSKSDMIEYNNQMNKIYNPETCSKCKDKDTYLFYDITDDGSIKLPNNSLPDNSVVGEYDNTKNRNNVGTYKYNVCKKSCVKKFNNTDPYYYSKHNNNKKYNNFINKLQKDKVLTGGERYQEDDLKCMGQNETCNIQTSVKFDTLDGSRNYQYREPYCNIYSPNDNPDTLVGYKYNFSQQIDDDKNQTTLIKQDPKIYPGPGIAFWYVDNK
jgi:hypothetical protein